MTFMGQASAGKGVKGFTQKEQLEVQMLVDVWATYEKPVIKYM